MADSEASIGLRIFLQDDISAGLSNISSLFTNLADVVQANSGAMSEAFDSASTSAQSLVDPLEQDTKATEELTQAVDASAEAFKVLSEYKSVPETLAESLDTATKAAEETVVAEEELANVSAQSAQDMLLQTLQLKVYEESLIAIGDALKEVGASSSDVESIVSYLELLNEESDKSTLSLEELVAELGRVEESVRQLATSEESLTSATSSATSAADAQVESTKQQVQATQELAQSVASTTQASSEQAVVLEEVALAADNSATSFNSVAQAASNMSSAQKVSADTVEALNNELLSIDAGLDTANGKESDLGRNMGLMIFSQYANQAAQAFDGLAGNIITSAGNLEEAFTRVQIATGVTGVDFDKMKNYIVDTANSSTFSAEQIAGSFALMGERGFTATGIMSGMGVSLINLAEATNSDVTPATNLLITAMRDYGAGAGQARQYADQLTYAFQHGLPDVSQMQSALVNVGGMAASLGIPFNQLMGSLTYLTNNGMPNASQAANSLRYIFQALTSPTTAAAQEFANLGLISLKSSSQLDELLATLSKGAKTPVTWDGTLVGLNNIYKAAQKAGDLKTDQSFKEWATSIGAMSSNLYDKTGKLKDLPAIWQQIGDAIRKLPKDEQSYALGGMFNVRSGQGARLMLDNPNIGADVAKSTNGEANSTKGIGLAASSATKIQKDFNTALGELKSSWNSFLGTMGTQILPTLTPLIQNINKIIGMLQGPGGASARTFILAFVGIAAIVAPIVAIGVGIAVLWVMLGTIAGPVFIAVGIIMGLVFVVSLIIASWKPVSAFFVGLWHSVVSAVTGAIGTIGHTIQSWAGNVGHWLQQIGTSIANGLKGGFNAAQAFVMHWGGVFRTSIVNAFNTAVNGVKLFGTNILNGVKGAFNAVIHFVAGLGSAFMGALSWLYRHNYYVQQFVDGFNQTINAVLAAFKMVGKYFQQVWTLTWVLLTIIVTDKLNEIKSGIQSGWNAVVSWWTNGLNSFKAWWSQHWQMFVQECQSAWNSMRAAAGVAWAFLSGIVMAGVNGIKGLLSYLFGWVPGAASRAWNFLSEMVRLGMTLASNYVTDKINSISSTLSSWGATLYQFGSNAIKFFADGIRAGIGWVTDAVNSVANEISHKLGFHSPPKGGILADSDTYMPNMMKMYGVGIRSNMHHITGPVGDIATSIATGINTPTVSRFQTAAAYSSSQAGNAQLQPVNISLDGKPIYQGMMNHLTGELKMNGLGRAWR